MTPKEIVEQVGLIFDEIWPNWYERVDPDRLDLRSCRACMIGQIADHGLTGRYMWGLHTLESHPRWPRLTPEIYTDYGARGHPFAHNETYLQPWRELIRERRAAAALFREEAAKAAEEAAPAEEAVLCRSI